MIVVVTGYTLAILPAYLVKARLAPWLRQKLCWRGLAKHLEKRCARYSSERKFLCSVREMATADPHGCLSRTQRPQFQPRLLLQCHPGPQPSAIRSTMCDIPVCNNGGPGKIAFAYASTTTEASKRTIPAAIKRSSFSVHNMEVTLAGRS